MGASPSCRHVNLDEPPVHSRAPPSPCLEASNPAKDIRNFKSCKIKNSFKIIMSSYEIWHALLLHPFFSAHWYWIKLKKGREVQVTTELQTPAFHP